MGLAADVALGGGEANVKVEGRITGGTGQAEVPVKGVAGGLPEPFTAQAFSVFVFFKGTSGGGMSHTGGGALLAFLLELGPAVSASGCKGRSGFGGTGGRAGLALEPLGDGVGSALIGEIDLSSSNKKQNDKKNNHCNMTRHSVNFIPGSS